MSRTALAACFAAGALLAVAGLESAEAGGQASSTGDAALTQPETTGRQIFRQRCKECHDDEFRAPPLPGVYGRQIATVEYDYSAALKARRGEVWNDANLDAFLRDSQAAVPGTEMEQKVPDDAERAALISYLKTLK